MLLHELISIAEWFVGRALATINLSLLAIWGVQVLRGQNWNRIIEIFEHERKRANLFIVVTALSLGGVFWVAPVIMEWMANLGPAPVLLTAFAIFREGWSLTQADARRTRLVDGVVVLGSWLFFISLARDQDGPFSVRWVVGMPLWLYLCAYYINLNARWWKNDLFTLVRWRTLALGFREAGLHHLNPTVQPPDPDVDVPHLIAWTATAVGFLAALPLCVRIANSTLAFRGLCILVVAGCLAVVAMRIHKRPPFAKGIRKDLIGGFFGAGLILGVLILIDYLNTPPVLSKDVAMRLVGVAGCVILLLVMLVDFAAALPGRFAAALERDPFLKDIGLFHAAVDKVTFRGKEVAKSKGLFAAVALVVVVFLPVYGSWLRVFGATNVGHYDLPKILSELHQTMSQSVPLDFNNSGDLQRFLLGDKAVVLLAYGWIVAVSVVYTQESSGRFLKPLTGQCGRFLTKTVEFQPIWLVIFVGPGLVMLPLLVLIALNFFFGEGFAIFIGAFGSALVIPRIYARLYAEVAFALLVLGIDEKNDRMDINHATLDEITLLPGIGRTLATSIVAARPLAGIAELDKLVGIGPERLAALHPLVQFG